MIRPLLRHRLKREKKVAERRTIESARRKSTLIPSGDLQEFEKPDWLIPSAQLGIEVSYLFPQKPKNAAFSSPQLAQFQQDVIRKAEICYRGIGSRPAGVMAYFKNDWLRKRNEQAMASEIAQFVWDNYPTDGGHVMLQQHGDGVHGWVDGLSIVAISCMNQPWDTSASSFIPILTRDQLNSRISAKTERLPEYRTRVPQGWEIWLLLATSISVLHSVAVPHEVTTWKFESNFERILLSPWDDDVFQLNISSPRK